MEGLLFLILVLLAFIYRSIEKNGKTFTDSLRTLVETVSRLDRREAYRQSNKSTLFPVYSEDEINRQSYRSEDARQRWSAHADELRQRAGGELTSSDLASLRTSAYIHYSDLGKLDAMIRANLSVIRGEKTAEQAYKDSQTDNGDPAARADRIFDMPEGMT